MKQHTVVITFDGAGNPVPLSADGPGIETTRRTTIGDQIRFSSSHGTVAVTFQPTTPFQDGPNGDATFRTLSAQGSFTYHCTVTSPDGIRHGWPDKADGGGTVEVGGK